MYQCSKVNCIILHLLHWYKWLISNDIAIFDKLFYISISIRFNFCNIQNFIFVKSLIDYVKLIFCEIICVYKILFLYL